MMDTLHIGSSDRELLCIKSEKIALTLKGRASHPNTYSDEELSSVKVNVAGGSLSVRIMEDTPYQSVEKSNLLAIPLFFEQRSYEICIEYEEGDHVTFWHENINIRNKISKTGKRYPMLSGMINFGNEIGYSDLVVLVNDKEYLKISIEVFPSKIDYKKDYNELLKDVTNEVYNLAFDFFKKTYQQMDIIQKVGNSTSEFFSIINFIFEKMLAASDVAISHVHHELQSYTQILPAHKVKKVDAKTVKWINTHPQSAKKNSAGRVFFEKVKTTKKQVSFDTFENRFIKYVLISTINRLESLKKTYIRFTVRGRKQDEDIILKINEMCKELRKRVEFTFLKNVGQLSFGQSMTLVFAMSPGYTELYKYYLMLQKGLSLHGSVFNISMKDTAQLYEYWCFIKLNSILRYKYKLVRQNILNTDKSGLFVTLKKGQTSRVEYENPINGEQIYLSYNQVEKTLPTVSQKPDNVLSLSKNEDNGQYEYIFDAKYRINMAIPGSDYYKKFSKPGPEVDDINTMHRYRDAIVYQSGKDASFKRTMFGAYVLFPYNDESEYVKHKFYQSIDAVNIGGLPFLPGSTGMVEKFLDELIIDSSRSAFERATLPKGIEEKLEHVDLKQRDVMVGMVRSKKQFDTCIANNFYYIPAKLIADNRFPIKYIALHQSKNFFGENAGITYYGEVRRCKKIKRLAITEIPVTTKKNGDELYYYFEIMHWVKLESRITLTGRLRTVNYYTNIKLLQYCKTSSELSFTSLGQLRLYTELKRISDNVRIREDSNSIDGFEFNGSAITIRDEEIIIKTYDGKEKRYLISYFVKSTKTVFKEIKDAVACE